MNPSTAAEATQTAWPSGRPSPRRRRRDLRLQGLLRSADLLRISLFSLTLVSISAIHLYLGPLRYVRPAILSLGLSCLIALTKPTAVRWRNLREAWPVRAVGVLLLLTFGSAVFGLSFGGSIRFLLESYSKELLIFALTVAAIRNVRELAILMWGFIAAVFCLLILAATVLDLEPTPTGLMRMAGGATMFDANDLGMLFLMGIPLAILMFYTAGKLGRLAAVAVILGAPAGIAMTGSRGAMVGMVIVGSVLLVALSRIPVSRRIGFVVAIAVALAIAAPPGYWQQMQTILNPEEDYNVSDEYGRIGIAKRGLYYMATRPLFGVGISNFERAEGILSPIAREREAAGLAVRWIAPHNTYVQVGAELGVFGLVTWLTLLVGGTVGLWRLRARTPVAWEGQSAERRFLREAMLFLPLSFIAFAVTSFFLSHAFTPPPYIFFAFLSGVVLLVRRELAADRAAALRARTAPVPSAAGPDAP